MSTNGSNGHGARDLRIAIIGAGFSGLGMAHLLKQAGMQDVTIYEKASQAGGTWRDNTYPGLSCDVPSRFYQYTFATNPDWKRMFAKGPEIQQYLLRFLDEHDLRRHIRFDCEITRAAWQDGRWRITTAAGDEDVVDVLINATGVLHHIRMPDIPGRDSFAGPSWHSARWDHSVPLQGKRVGLIGTGSTGAQITGALAGVASRLDVYQRSPDWVLSYPAPRYSRLSRALQRRFPALRRLSYETQQKLLLDPFSVAATQVDSRTHKLLAGLVRLNLRLAVRDPELRAKLTPDWEPFCKRLIISPNYLQALQHPQVDLVTEGIERIEPGGVRTTDGVLHELDVLVFATGFDAHAFMRPMQIEGADGITLEQAWADGPQAYKGVAMPGFPNMFILQGPHSPVGNYSLISIAEEQAAWVLRWVKQIRSGRITSVAPTQAATDAYYAELRAALPQTSWAAGGCSSWYHGDDGAPILWPWSPQHFRDVMRAEPNPAEFDIETPERVPIVAS